MSATDIIEFITVFLAAMLKFLFGPTFSLAAGYPYWKAVCITFGGMMASVFLFTYLGNYIKYRIFHRIYKPKKKKVFSKKNRRFVRIWKKHGVKGVAFLSPLLLTPIGGTLLLVTFGTPRKQIIFYMFVSAVFWSFTITGIIYFGKEMIDQYIPLPKF